MSEEWLTKHVVELNQNWKKRYQKKRMEWVTELPYPLVEWADTFCIEKIEIDYSEQSNYIIHSAHTKWYVRSQRLYTERNQVLEDHLQVDRGEVFRVVSELHKAGLQETRTITEAIREKTWQHLFKTKYASIFTRDIVFQTHMIVHAKAEHGLIELSPLYRSFREEAIKKLTYP